MTKQEIVHLLKTNDKAVCRALVVLTERQTTDEKRDENTKYANGRGYRPCHARMGTSMSEFYLRAGFLSPKQIAYWRRPMKGGKMRIEIYAGQLLEIAAEKAKKAITIPVQATTPAPKTVQWTNEDNKRWAEYKNEFAALEAEQERQAFESKMNREMSGW